MVVAHITRSRPCPCGRIHVGTELAGYRLESLIARGGMAVVYLAEHIRLERKVAFKILPPELADDENSASGS